jgi:diketogulonate reductase-like aldo/keto reductase
LLYKKEYHKRNRDAINSRRKIIRNKTKDREYAKRYFQTHKARYYSLRKVRLKEDMNYIIVDRIRRRVNRLIKNGKIRKVCLSKWNYIDYEEVYNHLMKNIPPDFNRTQYHIDHIRPLSSFDLSNKNELRTAWSPSNLQWLPAHENMRKSNKLNWEVK